MDIRGWKTFTVHHPNHSFSAVGTYPVQCTITNGTTTHTISITITVTDETFLLVDVTHSGTIPSTDAALVVNYVIHGKQTPIFGYTGTFDVSLADMNGSEDISSSNAAAIAHYVVTHK